METIQTLFYMCHLASVQGLQLQALMPYATFWTAVPKQVHLICYFINIYLELYHAGLRSLKGK